MCSGPGRAAGARVAALVIAAGCASARHPSQAPPDSDQIVLYRDRALLVQRVAFAAPRRGQTTLALQLPAGADPSDLLMLDHGGLPGALRLASSDAASGEPALDPGAAASDAPFASSDREPAPDEPGAAPDASLAADGTAARMSAAAPRRTAEPRRIELVAEAPRPGRFTVALACTTDQLTWDAAYTVTVGAAHDRATVSGTLVIRNATGLALRGAVRVIDAELGAWRDPTPAQRRAVLAGRPPASRDAVARSLGALALADGETRLALLADAPRPLRSVLVYDPVGTALDHAGAVPVFDPSLGAAARAPSAVRESLELAREPRDALGLPAGPAQLVERRADGSLAVLGRGRLFDPAAGIAAADTIAVGTARGVIARRERRDWGRDDDQRRLSEEFLITIDNARRQPVEVVVREHLYRGQNWTLAYQSVPAVKEGPQQIALRTTVPAGGRAKVLYVVVYTW